MTQSITGTTMFYDSVAKSMFMANGDKFEYLIGSFKTKAEGFEAGSARCRRLGWPITGGEHENAAKVA
ncbi:hypothetical protein [Endobacterium cereale]|uniref:hypothetical protein n=1 Tax=Endobacterium cereale TaxID=2663029 RepID=UPI002B477FFD|nr:hypothetical protein [Endobacterium cereale]MEB2846544.1 hypothetical protein [Endobacterium cereale]